MIFFLFLTRLSLAQVCEVPRGIPIRELPDLELEQCKAESANQNNMKLELNLTLEEKKMLDGKFSF